MVSLLAWSPRASAPPPPSASALPDWAAAAFPDGLERYSGHVWASPHFQWTITEQSARAMDAPCHEPLAAIESVRHFEHLLAPAVRAMGLARLSSPLVLALGAARPERAVLPWLSLLPQAGVIATDPGAVPLAAAAGRLHQEGEDERVLHVMAQPDDDIVAPGSVDVVSGIGCLHKLQDPDLVLAAAARALRPGGHAVFLEPFDGHGVLRLACEQICREADLRDEPLVPGVRRTLEDFACEIAARTLPDPTSAQFAALESKWLFGREALETAARSFGFSDVRFLSHNDHETLYRDVVLLRLRTSAGAAAASCLPAWALDTLDRFDQALRPPVKRLLMLEGTVILTR